MSVEGRTIGGKQEPSANSLKRVIYKVCGTGAWDLQDLGTVTNVLSNAYVMREDAWYKE